MRNYELMTIFPIEEDLSKPALEAVRSFSNLAPQSRMNSLSEIAICVMKLRNAIRVVSFFLTSKPILQKSLILTNASSFRLIS